MNTISRALAVFASFGLLAGCGGGAGATASSSGGSEPAAAKPAAAAPGKPAAAAPGNKPAGAQAAAANQAPPEDLVATVQELQAAITELKVPTQDEADAAAAQSISEANADAEYDKLMKEIDGDAGNP